MGKSSVSDPDPHGQKRIRIQEVKKSRKYTGSLGEYWKHKIKDPLHCRIRWAERGVGRTRQGEESSRTGERMKYEVGEG